MVIFGPGENMFICNGGTIPPIYDKIWIAKLINEGIMFILALRKGIINMREYNGRWSGSKLTALLVKDSALYFLVVCAFCLLSQLVWAIAGSRYIEVPVGISLTVGSIMSQHLLINIRKHASKKMGSVIDESWVTETTFEIGGTQLYANNTTLGTDGGVYDRSFGGFNPRTTTSV
ncbi:hypothetical protein PNOK_0830000 [Pyrrhoderma noxium]|uniref:Uncharacterized protein n=1 Tax=Pyrrhoderma noxium TaxID=2282107 RepID=A0A286UAT3_9AGAM|nr:hypothetical protein PNOK_0830000 [Pyrrhoderma noxium]